MSLACTIVRILHCVKQNVKQLTCLIVMAVIAFPPAAATPSPIIAYGMLAMGFQDFPNLGVEGSQVGLFCEGLFQVSAELSWNGLFQGTHPGELVLAMHTLSMPQQLKEG